MIWEPFVLALFLGLIVSAGLYFAYLWPSVEPSEAEPATVAADSPQAPPSAEEPPADEPEPAEAPAADDPAAAAETASADKADEASSTQ